MNWFDTSGLTSLAKSALKEAQKTIDKALDIQEDSNDELDDEPTAPSSTKSSPGSGNVTQKDNADFFSSWGLTVSAESGRAEAIADQPVVTESPSKSSSQKSWGSFAGSFFDQPKSDSNTIIRPPKAKSLNIISDKYDSQDDLFSKSQLVMSDGADCLSLKKEESPKTDDRRNSSMSNVLSFVSSRNSSDSVEVLSQSLKSTPDSEAVSCQSMSHSSSAGLKLNSESVEILPDSLVSPSSIECLGFDSYASDKNSSSSSNLSVSNLSDKKSTPVGERTEKAETADSVSLVADDDEDTMSYNSISECTAPTVLDTDDKPLSPFPKIARMEPRWPNERDLANIDQSLLASHKMQISENSSNDGSWSDRTLNADNDSITQENATEEQKKDPEQEDVLMEKLSDSSSFYNINVSADLTKSESSAFVNIEKQQCSAPESSESSQKEVSVKERVSPVSSESKSDLVKIGSDRTSGHTSGDELETATSSDIEIIPSPNGDSSNGCRNSPAKYGLKQKVDGATSPNLVDLVLGKSLATKIRGHNRELSEASVQSNTSDESQSENDRLMRRLCEMAEILDARENRLIEVTRSNAELTESNTSLKSQVESLMVKHEGGDINTLADDYTQRMSALEKKFQQVIREKDHLRKQLDTVRTEVTRKTSSEFESSLKEKEEMIAQLQEEGEKLARQELQHSTIIKKLRNKEKDNEQVIKGLRDRVAELTSELDRVKRSMTAKEEVEVTQIEAVYRLTTQNKKLETELMETKSALDDTSRALEGARTSVEALKRELADAARGAAELSRQRAAHERLRADGERAARDAELLRHELRQLRAERAKEEQRWLAREEALRREAAEAREAGEARAAGEAEAPAALLQQLAALQRGALERERAHGAAAGALAAQLAAAEARAAKAAERERLARDEAAELAERLAAALRDRLEANRAAQEQHERSRAAHELQRHCQDLLDRKQQELASLQAECEQQAAAQRARVSELEAQLAECQGALDTERKRNAILQEQVSTRGDISPSQSIASDSFSASFWQTEEGGGAVVGGGVSAAGVEEALAALTRKEGERRGLAAALAAARDERAALTARLAALQARLHDHQSLQEQYDALLQMYGEKEEQLHELRLDLHDVTQLYKAQLDELLALKQLAPR
ncbi:TATA element modulatory factor [Bicyclus anynana]|uniref:TATA element modulatory factor n=1 Tax=Bicyclus anynana TaxID=110368 RepID=A0ABM3LRR4_BICAN|nr:TATA element modulatory factor [Bicyclus anynana]